MYRKLECIALRTVRHSDRSSILTAYSREIGRVSLLVPAGNGRSAARMRALLMPLGRFDCVADIRPGKEMFNFRDVRPLSLPPAGDPLRSTLALFITDFLSALIRDNSPDPNLYCFLSESVAKLSSSLPINALQNFHIIFLTRLSRFLGIEPDWPSYTDGAIFDMRDGIFREAPPAHRQFLPSGEAAVAVTLSRLNYSTGGLLRLSRFDRNTILDRLLMYFQIHYPSVAAPASLPILRMMAD